jgi:hypothetical protein
MDTNELLDETVNAAIKVCSGFNDVALASDRRETLSYGLAALRATRRTLADAEKAFEQAIADSTDDLTFDVEHLGRVSVKKNKRRTKWQHDAIVREFAKAYSSNVAVPPDTIVEVLDQYRECVSTGAAKKPFVEFTGRDLDEFCKEEDAGIAIRIDEPEGAPRLDGF